MCQPPNQCCFELLPTVSSGWKATWLADSGCKSRKVQMNFLIVFCLTSLGSNQIISSHSKRKKKQTKKMNSTTFIDESYFASLFTSMSHLDGEPGTVNLHTSDCSHPTSGTRWKAKICKGEWRRRIATPESSPLFVPKKNVLPSLDGCAAKRGRKWLIYMPPRWL